MKNTKRINKNKINFKKAMIIISLLLQFICIATIYKERGYFAIGGEWLILPLIMLVIYGLAPTVKEFYQSCMEVLELEEENVDKTKDSAIYHCIYLGKKVKL